MDQNTVEEGKTYAIVAYITMIGVLIAYFMNKEKYPLEKVRKQFLKKYSKEELQKQI